MLTELIKLGLSEKEAKVYLSALELGAQTAQAIGKKAGVNRVTTYVILQMLMKKGLVSTFTKGKKTFFAAEPPEQLDHLLRKQEEDIFVRRRDLEKMIPELRTLFNLAYEKPKVRFFEGNDGVEAMIEEAYRKLPNGTTIHEFAALDELRAAFPSYESITTNYRLKHDVQTQVIYTHQDGEQEEMRAPTANRRVEYIAHEDYPFQASILIMPALHQVVIATYRRGASGVIIHNPELTRTLESIFTLLWKKLK